MAAFDKSGNGRAPVRRNWPEQSVKQGNGRAFFDEVRATQSQRTGEICQDSPNFDLGADKKERPAATRNGEEIPICARRVVTFPPRPEAQGKKSKPTLNPSHNQILKM